MTNAPGIHLLAPYRPKHGLPTMIDNSVIFDTDLSHRAFRLYTVLVGCSRAGLDFSKHDLAMFVGCKVESVDRDLAELAEAGLVEVSA